MTDWESTFVTWTKPSSETEETKCENAISMIKKAISADETLAKMDIRIFGQGSYFNNTNVRLNSDVDICICNLDVFFPHYPEGKSKSDFGNISSDYNFTTYKNQVEIALVKYFGHTEVKRGKKAFNIKSNTYRVDADAVPCFEHRRYGNIGYDYHSGIGFNTDDNNEVISWPKQHLDNGIMKNNNTNKQFKKVTRILKRLNLEMQDNNITIANQIPSFLIECLVWNAPDHIFNSNTYVKIIDDTLIHLYNSTKDSNTIEEWGEVSDLKYLFRPGYPWTYQDVNIWVNQAWKHIHS